jgi:hypothetical protein
LTPYHYSLNNPVLHSDPNGDIPPILLYLGAQFVKGAAEEYATQVAINFVQGKGIGDALTDVDGMEVLKAGATNAVTGGVGSIAREVRTVARIANAVDDAGDAGRAANVVNNAANSASSAVRKVDLELKYKKQWTAAQRAQADAKARALTEADTRVVKNPSRKADTKGRFERAGGTVNQGQDADHTVDLQLGGADDPSNMLPLDESVNRSMGAQIMNKIKNLPEGTIVDRVIFNGVRKK